MVTALESAVAASRNVRRTLMRKLSIALVLAALLAVGVAACGTSAGGGSATLTLGGSSFSGATSVTIQALQSVIFDDTAGGTHDLVTGISGRFLATPEAPSELSSADGLRLTAGDKKTITFMTPGTYQITCTLHPSMEATIIVTTATSSGD